MGPWDQSGPLPFVMAMTASRIHLLENSEIQTGYLSVALSKTLIRYIFLRARLPEHHSR